MLNAEIFIANIQKIRSLKWIEINKKMKNILYLLGTCQNKFTACTDIPAQSGYEKLNLRTTCNFQEKFHLYSINDKQVSIYETLTDETNKLTYISVIIVSYWINVKVIMQHSPCIRSCRRFIRDRMQNSQIIRWLCIHYGCYKKCRAQVCTDDDASAKDFINNFLYYSNKCLTKGSCADYMQKGYDDEVKYIYGMKESRMIQEIFVLGIHLISNCKAFYEDFNCLSYLNSCRMNGTICVSYEECTSNNGSIDFCNALSDSTGKDRCRPIVTAIYTSIRTSYDKVTATTYSECDTYLSVSVTRGAGCIRNSEPSTSYRGTKQQCELLKKTYWI
ncbi:unnamed protein product [Paramecium primaurelia]|uniref:Uncharacterized protein n=1 Tax=Paramecium primaurelia TaxID=5886 RepID=A0A8S1MZJ4_PARPR|nr:unnamed protein product [Paramecium primaurelia]